MFPKTAANSARGVGIHSGWPLSPVPSSTLSHEMNRTPVNTALLAPAPRRRILSWLGHVLPLKSITLFPLGLVRVGIFEGKLVSVRSAVLQPSSHGVERVSRYMVVSQQK